MRKLGRLVSLAWLVIAVGCEGSSAGPGGGGGTGGGSGTPNVRSSLACTSDGDCAADTYCVDRDGQKTCETLCLADADCPAGAHCLQAARGATVCSTAPVRDACASDGDCADGWLCIDHFCHIDSECSSVAACPDGEVCATGRCITLDGTRCAGTADCYDELGYCAGTNPDTCLPLACGGENNSCGRCGLGPNGGAPDPGGPLVVAPRQIRSGPVHRCDRDPEQCLPGAAPFACEFAFFAYDPDGDFPAEELGRHIRLVDRDGTLLDTFGGSVTPNANGALSEYRFRGCFGETADGRIAPAVVLTDRAGHHSQTQCMDGKF